MNETSRYGTVGPRTKTHTMRAPAPDSKTGWWRSLCDQVALPETRLLAAGQVPADDQLCGNCRRGR